jgi:CheY-like chemotaxis protein
MELAVDRAPLSVLVVEDSAVAQRLARVVLERSGCRVTIVDDGLEALLALQHLKVDIMLVDIGLPLMSGIELTRRVRASEAARKSRRLPVIAVTSKTTPEELDEVYRAGVDELVTKPYRPEELLQAIRRSIANDSRGVTAAA